MPLGSMFSSLNCASSRGSKLQKRTTSMNKKKQSETAPTTSPIIPPTTIQQETSPSAPPPYQLPDLTVDTLNVMSKSKGKSRFDATPSGESFWDLGNYKYVLKRCDNGNKLSGDLADMITERGKLEEAYAKSLRQWAKKWSDYLENESCEYGTTKDAWHGFLEAAGNRTAEVHSDACKSLVNSPVFKVKEWTKKKYEKHYINYKQTKEFEQEFEAAEKSWLELNEKLKKCRRDYYDAHRTVLQCDKTAKEARVNPKVSQDQRDKLDEKTKRAREDVERSRARYKDTLTEMDIYKPEHMRKMLDVFARTQTFEQERMLFVKQTLAECYDILDKQRRDRRFDELFDEWRGSLEAVDARADVEWWEMTFGPGTQANWPGFEEFQEK